MNFRIRFNSNISSNLIYKIIVINSRKLVNYFEMDIGIKVTLVKSYLIYILMYNE